MTEHERPAVTVDVFALTFLENDLRVLLIQRARPPHAGHWALPGGFVEPHEPLAKAAERELFEETGLKVNRLEQLHTFGDPGRDPRGWAISIAFIALVAADAARLIGDDEEVMAIQWHPAHDLPPLAFDHVQIIDHAMQRLRERADDLAWLGQALPARFTLSELQRLYELAGGQEVDKRNFRRWAFAQGCLEKTEAMRYGDHRPAHLYRLKSVP
ncbi:MAG: NUDIX hydrolase [Caldilineales bacterium]|nr:NUDIX hydrolase [Caldilineales bacterium]